MERLCHFFTRNFRKLLPRPQRPCLRLPNRRKLYIWPPSRSLNSRHQQTPAAGCLFLHQAPHWLLRRPKEQRLISWALRKYDPYFRETPLADALTYNSTWIYICLSYYRNTLLIMRVNWVRYKYWWRIWGSRWLSVSSGITWMGLSRYA